MAEYIKKEDVLDEAYWHGDRYTVQNPYPSGVEAVIISILIIFTVLSVMHADAHKDA